MYYPGGETALHSFRYQLLHPWCCPWCFRRSIGHVISRETENLQVPYYVDKNFEKNYQGAELQELEKTVEKDYIDYIQTSCWKEKQQSKLGLVQARASRPWVAA